MTEKKKKVKVNRDLDKAIKKLIEDAQAGKLIRSETVMALKLAVQWEAVKARLNGEDEYGSALAGLMDGGGDNPGDLTHDAGNPDE